MIAKTRGFPAGTHPFRINWRYTVVLSLVHGLALLACLPWFFSWLGVACLIGGYFIFGMLGITIGYHRLLAHRSFRCPKTLEHTLAVFGMCCLQESPVRWVAIHRMHHRNSDQRSDPHSPAPSFFWGYVGWLLVINRGHWLFDNYTRGASDLMRQRFYTVVEKGLIALWIYVLHAGLFFAFGWLVGWAKTADFSAAVKLGASVLIWGVFLRTVVFLHITWSVNAFSHVHGYRNYDTPDNSKNNVVLGILAHGDGWHNNHHARQKAANHGHKWWEVDLSYFVIRLLERLGLAYDVVRHTDKQTT